MSKERWQNRFSEISSRLSESIKIRVDPEVLRGEMRRVRGEVMENISQGNWDIKQVSSDLFQGVFPVLVHKGTVYVSKKIGAVHWHIFKEFKIPDKETPVGGFLWLVKQKLTGGGVFAIFETDSEVAFPNFPEDQLQQDRQALNHYLEENAFPQIDKAEYDLSAPDPE